MNECIKLSNTIDKYAFRNSPPYSANKCKSMKKKGNDGKFYISQTDKNGIYKWKVINNKTKKNKLTKKDLQLLAKKYRVTKSGTNKEIARRLISLRKNFIKNKTDKKILEEFL